MTSIRYILLENKNKSFTKFTLVSPPNTNACPDLFLMNGYASDIKLFSAVINKGAHTIFMVEAVTFLNCISYQTIILMNLAAVGKSLQIPGFMIVQTVDPGHLLTRLKAVASFFPWQQTICLFSSTLQSDKFTSCTSFFIFQAKHLKSSHICSKCRRYLSPTQDTCILLPLVSTQLHPGLVFKPLSFDSSLIFATSSHLSASA